MNQSYAQLWRSRQGRGQSDGICEAAVGADPTNRAPPRLRNKADIWRHHPSLLHLAHRGVRRIQIGILDLHSSVALAFLVVVAAAIVSWFLRFGMLIALQLLRAG